MSKSQRQGEPLVAIGSLNPAKTLGVRKVFSSFLGGGARFVEVDTTRVVRAQPVGLDQVVEGASKRAAFAISETDAGFGVGVEAGLLPIAREHVNLQVAFIVDSKGNTGLGLSSGFLIPSSFVRRIAKEGVELDRYSHELTRAEKISEEEGIVYHLTGGRISRLQMTEQSVSMALVPWLNAETYSLKPL